MTTPDKVMQWILFGKEGEQGYWERKWEDFNRKYRPNI